MPEISINKAVVQRREKNRTKTGVDREIALCGRALDVLKRQLKLREMLVEAGKISHDLVFFDEDGAPIINLSYPYRRWGYVLESRNVRYQELVAEEDGHSVATILKTYAAWTKGATKADVKIIERAMKRSPLAICCAFSERSAVRRIRGNSSPEVRGICHPTATTEG